MNLLIKESLTQAGKPLLVSAGLMGDNAVQTQSANDSLTGKTIAEV